MIEQFIKVRTDLSLVYASKNYCLLNLIGAPSQLSISLFIENITDINLDYSFRLQQNLYANFKNI